MMPGVFAGAMMNSGGGVAPIEPNEHIVVAFSQSSVYAGLDAANVANMSDGNGNGQPVTGTGTNGGGEQWVAADLGSAKAVSRIRLGGGNLPGWGDIFPGYALGPHSRISYSDDAINWTPLVNTLVGSYTNSDVLDRDVDIFVPPTVARYWRLWRTGYLATATFRVFGYTGALEAASGITYSQSSVYSGLPASEAVLNEWPVNTNNGAATDSEASAWIRADLGSTKTVGAVVLGAGPSMYAWGPVSFYLNDSVLEYSHDGSAWTTALTVTDVYDDLPSIFTRELPLIAARYWRVRRNVPGYLAMTAFRLYVAS